MRFNPLQIRLTGLDRTRF